jgi:hypothetical protein
MAAPLEWQCVQPDGWWPRMSTYDARAGIIWAAPSRRELSQELQVAEGAESAPLAVAMEEALA